MPIMHTYTARVAQTREIAAELVELALELPRDVLDSAAPGQCAHIKVPKNASLLLRRPISIYSVKDGLLRLAIQPKGEGTWRIVSARPGDTLDILFPFGNGFRADAAQSIWLVGGGVGVAPLRCCAEAFFGRVRRAFFGYRDAAHVYAANECEAAGVSVRVCTDDGSAGEHALVTEPFARALGEEKPELILACGPTPMLRAVQKIAAESGVPAQLSLEARMGCGVGACLTCTCAASSGLNFRVCADGPVFDAKAVAL